MRQKVAAHFGHGEIIRDNAFSFFRREVHPHIIIGGDQRGHEIFDKFVGAPLYYWHDTGHAEVFSRMLWSKSHAELIAPLAKHIGGFHLHDLRGIVDHYAPGSGDFDFKCLLPYIKNKPCLVVESHAKSTFDELSNSIKHLNSIGIA